MNFKLNVGPGLLLGIPTLGRPIPLDWALAFKNLNPPINFNVVFNIIQNQEIGLARNEMAKNAIEKNCKYLFFIGDDVVVPNHTLRSMIYKMDQRDDIGVIGGVYCAKVDPAFPLVFRGNGQGSYWDWKIGEFFEVTGLGMDCTIIRVDMLRKMYERDKVLFKTVKSDQFLDGINSADEYTEDLYFLKRVVEEQPEYKIFCDGGIICDHWDIKANKKYNLPPDSLPRRQRVVDDNLRKLLDLGGHLPPQAGYEIITAGEELEGKTLDYRCDYSQLPFDSEVFDAVNVTGIFNKPDTVSGYVKEIKRVLKKGCAVKVTYSGWINPTWLEKCFEAESFVLKSNGDYLLEAVKE